MYPVASTCENVFYEIQGLMQYIEFKHIASNFTGYCVSIIVPELKVTAITVVSVLLVKQAIPP